MTLTLKVNPAGIQVHLHTKLCDPSCNTYGDMNYCLVNFGPVTDRRKAMHKSPLCMSTGGLKNPMLTASSGVADRQVP